AARGKRAPRRLRPASAPSLPSPARGEGSRAVKGCRRKNPAKAIGSSFNGDPAGHGGGHRVALRGGVPSTAASLRIARRRPERLAGNGRHEEILKCRLPPESRDTGIAVIEAAPVRPDPRPEREQRLSALARLAAAGATATSAPCR